MAPAPGRFWSAGPGVTLNTTNGGGSMTTKEVDMDCSAWYLLTVHLIAMDALS